jgi:hypothetical protein
MKDQVFAALTGGIGGILVGCVLIVAVYGVLYWRMARKYRREEQEIGRGLVQWMDALRDAKSWDERRAILDNPPSGRKRLPDGTYV